MKCFFRFEYNFRSGAGHYSRISSIINEIEDHIECYALISNKTNQKDLKVKKKNVIQFPLNKEEEYLINLSIINKNSYFFFDIKNRYSKNFFKKLKKNSKKIIIIDDDTVDPTYIDYIIIPGLYKNLKFKNKFKHKIKYGFKWAIIKREILELLNIKSSNKFDILITMGASDVKNLTSKFIKIFLNTKFKVIILIGDKYRYNTKIKKSKNLIFRKFNYKYLKQTQIAISAWGVSCYELVNLRIPLIVIGHDKKKEITNAQNFFCKKVKKISNLENPKTLNQKVILFSVNKLLKQKKNLNNYNFSNGQKKIKELLFNDIR